MLFLMSMTKRAQRRAAAQTHLSRAQTITGVYDRGIMALLTDVVRCEAHASCVSDLLAHMSGAQKTLDCCQQKASTMLRLTLPVRDESTGMVECQREQCCTSGKARMRFLVHSLGCKAFVQKQHGKDLRVCLPSTR